MKNSFSRSSTLVKAAEPSECSNYMAITCSKKNSHWGGKVFMFFRLAKPLFLLSDVCNNAVT